MEPHVAEKPVALSEHTGTITSSQPALHELARVTEGREEFRIISTRPTDSLQGFVGRSFLVRAHLKEDRASHVESACWQQSTSTQCECVKGPDLTSFTKEPF